MAPDLPALLRLVDDPSPHVAQKVAARLRTLGDEVWNDIEERALPLSPSQRVALQLALAPSEAASAIEPQSPEATTRLWQEWRELQSERDEIRFLGSALCAISSWLRGEPSSERCAQLLDELAARFRDSGEPFDAASLSGFLFETGELRGADASRFTQTSNSDLLFTLEEGEGLPITLSCVFILVGARLGIVIEGCNFPGHFLTRDASERSVFDPYNRGRMLSPREVASLRRAAPTEMSEARVRARSSPAFCATCRSPSTTATKPKAPTSCCHCCIRSAGINRFFHPRLKLRAIHSKPSCAG